MVMKNYHIDIDPHKTSMACIHIPNPAAPFRTPTGH